MNLGESRRARPANSDRERVTDTFPIGIDLGKAAVKMVSQAAKLPHLAGRVAGH
jgi:hypothetical protein